MKPGYRGERQWKVETVESWNWNSQEESTCVGEREREKTERELNAAVKVSWKSLVRKTITI